MQINIESGTLDLDDEIDQLRSSVGRLKQVGGAGEAWGHCQSAHAGASRTTFACRRRRRCRRPHPPAHRHPPRPTACLQVSQAIGEESRLTTQVMEGLESAMEQARGSLRKTMKRLGRAYQQSRSNHMTYLLLFAILLFFGVYFWNKVYRFLTWIF